MDDFLAISCDRLLTRPIFLSLGDLGFFIALVPLLFRRLRAEAVLFNDTRDLVDVVEPELLIEDRELFALSIGDCDSYLAFDFR
jgi:hypothetical protein